MIEMISGNDHGNSCSILVNIFGQKEGGKHCMMTYVQTLFMMCTHLYQGRNCDAFFLANMAITALQCLTYCHLCLATVLMCL